MYLFLVVVVVVYLFLVVLVVYLFLVVVPQELDKVGRTRGQVGPHL